MPSDAWVLLQVGVLLFVVLVGQLVGQRHLQAGSVPLALRSRVEFSNRVRPWLMVGAVALVCAGVLVAL